MKTICLYFQIHQPFRLKRYRFFDIGADHYYYDDYNNENIINRLVEQSYMPAIMAIKEMIAASEKRFKVAFSISGTALEQLEIYAPEFIDQMRDLLRTGSVELLAETYAHSLSSMSDMDEFKKQVSLHTKKIENAFEVKPTVFCNTELIYSDEIAEEVAKMGFKGMMVEGAKHILGWKSPNYIYASAANPKLKLLMRNYKLSDDISFRFSNYSWSEFPLTAEKYLEWIASTPTEEKVISLFMSLDTLGGIQPAESGIFEFIKALPRLAPSYQINFELPSVLVDKIKPMDQVSTAYPFSWADEDKGTSAWLGNRLQQEAFRNLYKVAQRVHLVQDRRIQQDWQYLQSSDHFFYMSSKHHGADSAVHSFFSPYESPYEAFTNYMNVLSDFMRRVNEQYPSEVENEELNSLLTTIKNQAIEIETLKMKLSTLSKGAKTKKKSSVSTKQE